MAAAAMTSPSSTFKFYYEGNGMLGTEALVQSFSLNFRVHGTAVSYLAECSMVTRYQKQPLVFSKSGEFPKIEPIDSFQIAIADARNMHLSATVTRVGRVGYTYLDIDMEMPERLEANASYEVTIGRAVNTLFSARFEKVDVSTPPPSPLDCAMQ